MYDQTRQSILNDLELYLFSTRSRYKKKFIFPPVSAYSFYVAELVVLRIFEVSLECVVSLFIDVILEL